MELLRTALKEGVANGLRSGLFYGFPLVDVQVSLTKILADPGVSPTALKAAVTDAVRQGAQAAAPALLEPIMKVRVFSSSVAFTGSYG